MLRVPISQARPGMELALEVRHPRTGVRLLGEGYELDQHLIDKLIEMHVHEIWIDYPDTDAIKEYLSPTVVQQHGRVVSVVAEVFDLTHRGAHAQLDFPRYRQTLRDLIESLVAEPTSAAYIFEMGGESANELRHAGEVSLLSILLGLKLQGYLVTQRKRLQPFHARNVVSLGLGAMLHDVGVKHLDPEVRKRYEETRDESDEAWRQHVALGHREVTSRIPPSAAGIVLHHHQYYDGSGFPVQLREDGRRQGLRGDEIHVFARIVCVANHFDRLRHRGDGTILPRVRVLKQMLAGELTGRFDPVVLASLPMVVPAYPPGSIVKLNNGEPAIVCGWHPEAPCQPLVQVKRPKAAWAEDEPRVLYDLRERRDLLIVEVDGVDVSRDNFRLTTSPRKLEPAA